MRVTLELPRYVEELIEFIPAEEINDVLIDIIYEGIRNRVMSGGGIADSSSATTQENVGGLLQELKALLQTSQTVVSKDQTFAKEEHTQIKEDTFQDILQVNETKEEIEFDDFDFDGFGDLMK